MPQTYPATLKKKILINSLLLVGFLASGMIASLLLKATFIITFIFAVSTILASLGALTAALFFKRQPNELSEVIGAIPAKVTVNDSIYHLSAKRRWAWLKNLIHLKAFRDQEIKFFSYIGFDDFFYAHSLDKNFENSPPALWPINNKLPEKSTEEYISYENFLAYRNELADGRNYKFFSTILFYLLKYNSINILQLLKILKNKVTDFKQNGVTDKPYALFYEEQKSQQWLASLFLMVVNKKPAGFVKIEGNAVHSPSIEESINKGIRNFLWFDDCAYSGSQSSSFMNSFDRWDFKIPHGDSITIHMTFCFITSYAKDSLQRQAKNFTLKNPQIKVVIHIGRMMPTLNENLRKDLPYKPEKNEEIILDEILENTPRGSAENLRIQGKKCLLISNWKKADGFSTCTGFMGTEEDGPSYYKISKHVLNGAATEKSSQNTPHTHPAARVPAFALSPPSPYKRKP